MKFASSSPLKSVPPRPSKILLPHSHSILLFLRFSPSHNPLPLILSQCSSSSLQNFISPNSFFFFKYSHCFFLSRALPPRLSLSFPTLSSPSYSPLRLSPCPSLRLDIALKVFVNYNHLPYSLPLQHFFLPLLSRLPLCP